MIHFSQLFHFLPEGIFPSNSNSWPIGLHQKNRKSTGILVEGEELFHRRLIIWNLHLHSLHINFCTLPGSRLSLEKNRDSEIQPDPLVLLLEMEWFCHPFCKSKCFFSTTVKRWGEDWKMSLAVESLEVLILQVCFLSKYVSETLSELGEFLISTNKLKEMPLDLTLSQLQICTHTLICVYTIAYICTLVWMCCTLH